MEPVVDSAPTRVVHKRDALEWLSERSLLEGCSIVTSLPDFSEFPEMTCERWKTWFTDAVALVLSRCAEDGVAIFYQTDLKFEGGWIDKGYLCQKAAERLSIPLVWHKLVCRVPAGNIAFGRPAYSHMLCFSRGIRAEISKSSADVLPRAGDVTWTRGMGVEACLAACRFILSQTSTRTVVDPFCGHGTVLAVANSLGMNAVGVERSPKRVRAARRIEYVDSRLTKSGLPIDAKIS